MLRRVERSDQRLMQHGLGLLKSPTNPKSHIETLGTGKVTSLHISLNPHWGSLLHIDVNVRYQFRAFLNGHAYPFASPARMIIGAARLYFPFKGKVSMVRRVGRWCDSTKAIRYEPWKTPTVVGPARLGKRFPKSEYRKLEIRGRSVLTPDGGFLLCVSPRSAFCLYVCTVTWKLAASLKSQFDVCDHFLKIEDLDSSMPIGECDGNLPSVFVQLDISLLAAGPTSAW